LNGQFTEIVKVIDARFPGELVCKLGNYGQAKGLYVTRAARDGYAFVFEPDGERFLLSLHDSESDTGSETWSALGAEDVVRRIEPWAFPSQWTPPAPLDRQAETLRLKKIAKGLAARGEIKCDVEPSKAEFVSLLTEDGKGEFERDIEQVRGEKVIRNFPWDAAGRLALDAAVLLNVYRSSKPRSKDRHLCLAALGPARRRDEQSIRIQLTDLIVVNQSHNWMRQRWMWSNSEVPHFDIDHGEGQHDDELKRTLSLRLLDDGQIEEALSLFGVTMSDDLHRLLGGERISPPACCAHPDETWRSLLIETLRESAPWLLPKAVMDEAARLKAWAAEKKGRGRRRPRLKLVIFPGQPHARKASLMLAGDVDGSHPRFEIEATASNARAADSSWKRPILLDFKRFGIDAE